MSSTPSSFAGAVIVVVHGPSADSLRSVRNLSSALPEAEVIAVAGTEPGVGALRRLEGRMVRRIEGHGPVAVTAAVAAAGSDPVLVVHDDVELTGATVDRLRTAHAEWGSVAVPSPEPTKRDQLVTRASMACVLGSGRQLHDLVSRGAFGPGLELDGEFVAVQGAAVRHDKRCVSRLAPDRADGERPLLVAGMIVRDESAHLADCLAALEPLVDRVEIVDTGSLDDTRQIAARLGARVHEVAWRDDFGWARNQVLERCRDARYVLWVDADERVQCPNPQRFRQLLATLADHFPAYRLRVRDVDPDGERASGMWATRLFRPDGVHFVGAIHERVEAIDGSELLEVATEACGIDHLGYQRASVSDRDKFERNVHLAEQAFERDPSPETRAHYYRSLAAGSLGAGDPTAALATMDGLIADLAVYDGPTRGMLATLRANVCLALDDAAAALTSAREAVDAVPADPAAVAVLVESLVRLDRPEDAISAVVDLADRPSPQPLIDDNLPASQGRDWARLRAHLAIGQPDEALALVPALAPGRDPWPDLVAAPSLDLARAVDVAASAGDQRFAAAIAASDRSLEELTDVLGLLEDARVSDGLGPLRRAIVRLETRAAVPVLRATYAASGAGEDLEAYARAALDGFGDLVADLAALDPDAPQAERAAEMLALCADAHARREDTDAAIGDGVEALSLWPGAVRAGVVVATAAAASGMPEMALDIIGTVRDAAVDRDIPARHRHALADAAVLAWLAAGHVRPALEEAATILGEGGDLETWDALIAATAEDLEQFAPVLNLALASDGAAFIDATRQTLPAENAAATCLSYLAAGGTNPDAVTTGLVTATVHGREDLAELFLEHRELIEPDDLNGLATVLRGRGHDHLADRLEPAGA